MPAPDRRTARSKRALRAALVQRLRDQDYDTLTVGELLETADVGRSTFYSHYSGKDDLLRQSLRTMHAEIGEVAAAADGAPGLAFLDALLEHLQDHRALYKHLDGRGAAIFAHEFDLLVGDLVRGAVRAGAGDGKAAELAVHFVRGGVVAVLIQWLERPAARRTAEVAAAIRRLVERGAADVLP